MSADPDAPEWASYAGAWHDAQMHTPPPVRDEVWSGQGWSEKPDRRERELD
jgi:hypothetical protein